MSRTKTYTLEYITKWFNDNDSKLISDPKTYTTKTKMQFTCKNTNCGYTSKVLFATLLKNGAYCLKCQPDTTKLPTTKHNSGDQLENYRLQSRKFTKHTLSDVLKKSGAELTDFDSLPDFIGSKSNVIFKCLCGTISIKCLKSLTNERLGSFCTKCNHKNAILRKKKASDIQEKELNCIKCKETKPIDSFLYESTTWKKEISDKCKDCRAKKRKTDQDYVKRKKEEVVLNKDTHKKCTGPCNNILPYSEFTGNNKTCITCGIKRRKQFASRKESAVLAKTLHPDSQLCIGCYHLYPSEDFITDHKKKQGNYCKICRERDFERQDVVAEKLLELKEQCVCIDCGETNIKLLEFDHINPEEKRCNVGNCRSVKALEEEIAKCEVRCIICHIRRTKKQFFYKQNTLKPGHIFIDECKRKIGKCELCLWFDPELLEALQFDHLDQSTKLNTVSRLASLSKDIEIIKEEIAKCRLICAHCHKLHTIEQLGYLMYSGDRREARKEKIKTI